MEQNLARSFRTKSSQSQFRLNPLINTSYVCFHHLQPVSHLLVHNTSLHIVRPPNTISTLVSALLPHQTLCLQERRLRSQHIGRVSPSLKVPRINYGYLKDLRLSRDFRNHFPPTFPHEIWYCLNVSTRLGRLITNTTALQEKLFFKVAIANHEDPNIELKWNPLMKILMKEEDQEHYSAIFHLLEKAEKITYVGTSSLNEAGDDTNDSEAIYWNSRECKRWSDQS